MSDTASSSQEQENLKTLQAYWEAMDRDDIDTAIQTLDEECVVHTPESLPYGGIYKGRDEIRRFWSIFFQIYERPQPMGLQLLTAGDYIITLQTLKTRIRGSNAELEMPMAETFKLRASKIIEIRPYYFDTAKMSQVISRSR